MTKYQNVDGLVKSFFSLGFVIPAKAGIQYYQVFPGFRVKPGMTNRGVMQRSQLWMKRTSLIPI